MLSAGKALKTPDEQDLSVMLTYLGSVRAQRGVVHECLCAPSSQLRAERLSRKAMRTDATQPEDADCCKSVDRLAAHPICS